MNRFQPSYGAGYGFPVRNFGAGEKISTDDLLSAGLDIAKAAAPTVIDLAKKAGKKKGGQGRSRGTGGARQTDPNRAGIAADVSVPPDEESGQPAWLWPVVGVSALAIVSGGTWYYVRRSRERKQAV